MKEQKIRNAIIEAVTFGKEDRNLLSCWLHLDYGDGTHQGFGGFVLYLPKSFKHYNILSHAGHFIFRCMEIAEVDSWDKMKGRSIRVKFNTTGSGFSSEIVAIGHIVKNDWFNPTEDFSKVPNNGQNVQVSDTTDDAK